MEATSKCGRHPDCTKVDEHSSRCAFEGGISPCQVRIACQERSNHFRTSYCAGGGKDAVPKPNGDVEGTQDTTMEDTTMDADKKSDEVEKITAGSAPGPPASGPPAACAVASVSTVDASSLRAVEQASQKPKNDEMNEITAGNVPPVPPAACTVAPGATVDDMNFRAGEKPVTQKPMVVGMLIPTACMNAAARKKLDSVAVGVSSLKFPGLASNWCISMITEGTSKQHDGNLVVCRLICLSCVFQWPGRSNEFGRKFVTFPVHLAPQPGDDNFFDQEIFLAAHKSIEYGFITSQDPGMTAFGMTEAELNHEHSRVSSEMCANPKYGQCITAKTDSGKRGQIPASQAPVPTTRQLRARNVCSAGEDNCVGNGETRSCESDVHLGNRSFHHTCPPSGGFDERGSWLCMDNKSCQEEMKKRFRLAAKKDEATRKAKAKKVTSDRESEREREALSKSTQKPSSVLPVAVTAESLAVTEMKEMVSESVASALATSVSFQQAEGRRTGEVSGAASQVNLLLLSREWRVLDDARQDKRDQDARAYNTAQSLQYANTTLRVLASVGHGAHYHDSVPSVAHAPAPPLFASNGEKERKSKKHQKSKKRSRGDRDKESKKKKKGTSKKKKKKKKKGSGRKHKSKRRKVASTSSSGSSSSSSISSSSSSSSSASNSSSDTESSTDDA
jgi:hypothetical protein